MVVIVWTSISVIALLVVLAFLRHKRAIPESAAKEVTLLAQWDEEQSPVLPQKFETKQEDTVAETLETGRLPESLLVQLHGDNLIDRIKRKRPRPYNI